MCIRDRPVVEALARRLVREGLDPWVDVWHLIPGTPWQPAIEEALARSLSCAVFIGRSVGFEGSRRDKSLVVRSGRAYVLTEACNTSTSSTPRSSPGARL